ncbi:CPBP family intramembrane metalloprotease [Escherichia coli]|nr:CPBP family intramembrane metalloprotease [Escherichia coli]HBP4332715.1 CPBP family intramembrane metalloprotease [Escherichia coli]
MDNLKQRLLILIFGLSNYLFFYLLLTSIDLNIFLMTRLNFSMLHLQIIKPLIMLLIFLSITHLLNNTSIYQGISWGKPSKQSFVFLTFIIIAYAASYYLTPKEPFVTDFTKGLSHEMAVVKITATIIIIPLLEELVFRGIILSSFLNAFGEKAGYIIGGLTVSVLFALIHTQYSFPTKIQMFALSLIFCGARYQSRGLLLPILLHAFCIALGLYIELK